MNRILLGLASLATSLAASAQTITTVVGGGIGDGGPATSAIIRNPEGLAVDAAGNVYVVADNRVRKVAAGTGTITTIAGNGVGGLYGARYSGDGVATDANLYQPRGVAVDGTGAVYLADELGYRIFRIAGGQISTFAGTGSGSVVGFTDGMPATQAALNSPTGVAVDSTGNVYIGDWGAGRVLQVQASDGTIRRVVGNLASPVGVGVDGGDRVLIADTGGRKVYRYDPVAKTVGLVAGIGSAGADADTGDGGPATAAQIMPPRYVAADAANNFFIASFPRVRRVDATSGLIATIAGTGTSGYGGDGGPATSAQLGAPTGIAVAANGALYIADNQNGNIRRVVGGVIETFAGVGADANGDGNPATQAYFQTVTGLARDAAGNLFVVDSRGHRIRRVDAVTGLVSTVVGSSRGFSGDGGPATAAQLQFPEYVAIHPITGELYFSDTGNNRVRKVDGGGTITTVAGGGGAFADGVVATASTVNQPRGLAFDAAGNLYIAEYMQARIRKVAAGTNLISTVPGTANLSFGLPYDVKLDAAGNIYFAIERYVMRVDAVTGAVSTVIGNGTAGGPIDGELAATAAITFPAGLAIDAANTLYVTSLATHRIYRIQASTGRVTTIAGTGVAGFTGDEGPAASARLYRPYAATFDGAGNLLFADSETSRVRKVTLTGLFGTALAFDSRLPNTTSLPRRMVISNLGASPITVSAMTAPAGFAIVANTCAVVAAGGDCTVDVTFTPTAVGPASGNLAATTDAGPFTFGLSGAGELSLVTFYYESILRRSPDSSGKPYWDGERSRMQGLGTNANETWFAMSSSFFLSPEYVGFNRDATGFVTDLYKTFFNRAPDAPGLQFWIDQLSSGMPREVVLAQFQLSAEFAAFTSGYFGNTPVRVEVNVIMDFYRGLLGRLPDTDGFNAWKLQFRNAQCGFNPPAAVANLANAMSEAFATSLEYVGKNRSNGQYVGDLYNAYLRRGGELSGVRFWVDALDAGTLTRAQVREAFRASDEFTGRISQVVAQGCPP